MSFAWMRRIDSWVGKPLTGLLALFTSRPKSLFGDLKFEKLPKRVICSKFIGMGSVVLSLPLLKGLKESGVRVAFWSFPGQAELARISGYVDEVWIIEPSIKKFLPTLLKTIFSAWRFRAEAFLDLEPTANFSAVLARLSGAKTRIGFMSAKPIRESLFTHLVALTSERHIIENHLLFGRLIGMSTYVSGALPRVPASISETADPVPFRSVQSGRKRIVINVNSSDLSWHRMWPEDHWVLFCKELLKDPTVDLVFPGAPSEQARADRLVKRLEDSPRVLNIAGQTSLIQLMRVLQGSSLVVSVDSGIMHLAAWVGTPLVALFGPETPKLYGPRTPSSRVLWAGLPCSPCLNVAADKITRCRDNQCMKKITPEQVLSACRSLLRDSTVEKVA